MADSQETPNLTRDELVKNQLREVIEKLANDLNRVVSATVNAPPNDQSCNCTPRIRENKRTDEETYEECAKICERPWWKLAPGMVEIKNEPILFGEHPSQGEVFSFINDLMMIRAQEIRGLLAQSQAEAV